MLSLAARTLRHLWKRTYREDIRGFEVGFVSRGDANALRGKLEAALDVINDHDPAGFETLRVTMPRLYLTGTPTHLACYWRELGLCELRVEYVEQAQPLDLAMTLVHEGLHARVTARGLHRRGLSVAREERLAIRAEIALARRAGADRLVAQAEHRLAAPDSTYVSDRRLARELLAARQMGFPLWIVRWAARRRGIRLEDYAWSDPFATDRQRRRVEAVYAYARGPTWLVRALCYVAWASAVVTAGALLPPWTAGYLGIVFVAGVALIGAGLRQWTLVASARGRDLDTAAG